LGSVKVLEVVLGVMAIGCAFVQYRWPFISREGSVANQRAYAVDFVCVGVALLAVGLLG
jgi:hypothetical protein